MPKPATAIALSVLVTACSGSHGRDEDAGPRPDGWIGSVDAGRFFPQPRSWNVVATLRPTGSESFPDGTTELRHAFTMDLRSGGDGTAASTAGAFGDQTELAWNVTSDHELALGAPAEIAIPTGSTCGGYGPVTYRMLELAFTDLDGDNWDDRVTGTAAGAIRFHGGDVIWDVDFTATVVAMPDEVPPTLEVSGGTSDRNPTDGVFVRIDEPIGSGLSVVLLAPDGSEIRLARPEGREASFTTAYGTVLAFGATYSIAVWPVFSDLAGNEAPTMAGSITTAADPGVQPEDGFEGGALALVRGETALVDAADGAAVISGSSSLVLPPSPGFGGTGGGRATLRLAVGPSDTTLHLRYALLALDTGGGFFFGNARALADGSDPVQLPIASGPVDTWTDSGIANAPLRGPVQDLAVALPATAIARGEVILDVTVDTSPCGGPLPSLLGLMLDDVRVE